MNQNAYIRNSLELHLFFDRIMMEHSLFLEASFIKVNQNQKDTARGFHQSFCNLLKEVVMLANGNISPEFLLAQEIVTPHTEKIEEKTQNLTGIPINTGITEMELNLQSGMNYSEALEGKVHEINKKSLPLIWNLIRFKEEILKDVTHCNMYTTNYPLLIKHILEEAKMYYTLLSKVEKGEDLSRKYIYDQEILWNHIMKEHAEFIRGLLDPSEKELILTADKYSIDYTKIIQNYNQNNSMYLTNASLKETISFRDFKVTGENKILNCQVKSIILPLLADHVVREANHFIRLLRNFNLNQQEVSHF